MNFKMRCRLTIRGANYSTITSKAVLSFVYLYVLRWYFRPHFLSLPLDYCSAALSPKECVSKLG